MRFMSAVLVFVLTAPVWASEPACESEAIGLVSQLESVLSDINGVIQGDYDEDVIYVTDTKSNGTDIVFNLSSDHMNEDLEGWTQNYKVSYFLSDGVCYLQNYQYLGASAEEVEE